MSKRRALVTIYLTTTASKTLTDNVCSSVAQPEWGRRGHSSPETNLLRLLLVLCINFQLLERCQWQTTSLTGPFRTKLLAALLLLIQYHWILDLLLRSCPRVVMRSVGSLLATLKFAVLQHLVIEMIFLKRCCVVGSTSWIILSSCIGFHYLKYLMRKSWRFEWNSQEQMVSPFSWENQKWQLKCLRVSCSKLKVSCEAVIRKQQVTTVSIVRRKQIKGKIHKDYASYLFRLWRSRTLDLPKCHLRHQLCSV